MECNVRCLILIFCDDLKTLTDYKILIHKLLYSEFFLMYRNANMDIKNLNLNEKIFLYTENTRVEHQTLKLRKYWKTPQFV